MKSTEIMCPYIENCRFPSLNCTLENAQEFCELFEDFEKNKEKEKENGDDNN